MQSMGRRGLVMLGALGAMIATGAAAASKQDRAQDERALRALVDQMTAGFNAHDERAATAMYADDADFVNVRGERAQGRADIEKKLAEVFAARARVAKLTTLDVTIRFARSDVAIVHVTNEMNGLIAPDGSRLPPHRELSVRIVIKSHGQWKVTAFHNTIIAPSPPPSREHAITGPHRPQ